MSKHATTTVDATHASVATQPAHELALDNPLSQITQTVEDESGTPSALALSTQAVTIKRPDGVAGDSIVLRITGPAGVGTAPAIAAESPGPEISFRFLAGGDNSDAWHIGSFDDGRFFFWTPTKLFVMELDAKTSTVKVVNLAVSGAFTVNGTINAAGLNATGTVSLNGANIALPNLRPASEAPNPATLEQVMVDPATFRLYYQ